MRFSLAARLLGSLSCALVAACSAPTVETTEVPEGEESGGSTTLPPPKGSKTGESTPGSGPSAPGTTTPSPAPAPPTGPATPGVDPPALADGAVGTVPANCKGAGQNGNGTITRTSRAATGFTDVQSEFAGSIVVQEGSTFRVQVETDSNLQNTVTTAVTGPRLVVGTQSSTSLCYNFLRVIVTLPAFRAALLDGSGDIDIAKTTPASDVTLILDGAGNIKFSGKAKTLGLALGGAGTIELGSGSATSTQVELTGAGDIVGNGFSPGPVTGSVTGAGSVSF